MALSSTALTTVATVEAELGLSSGSADALLERYIEVASDALAQMIGRALTWEQGAVDRVPGYGRKLLVTPRRPVSAINSIRYDDDETSYTIPASTYRIEDGPRGFIRFDAIGLGGVFNTALRVGANGEPLDGSEGWFYRIDYDAGWVTPEQAANDGSLTRDLPYDLEDAAVAIAVHMYRERGRNPNVTRRGTIEASVAFAEPNAMVGWSGLPAVRRAVATYGAKWGMR